MQPPTGIDMNLIREALARRAQGASVGAPAGMSGNPMAAEAGQPTQGGPTGGSASPMPTGPPQTAPTGPLPQGGAQQGQPQQPTSATQRPQYDDPTKAHARALVAQLLKVL